MSKLIINTDGGSRGNPGKGACAFVIFDENGKKVMEEGKYLGVCTNNEAEYEAVILALRKVVEDWKENIPEEIEFRADSKLVVEQLSGRFKVKNIRIQTLFGKVRELEKNLHEINYSYIPREENYQADRLVNQILDCTL
ncbi:MAG: ribonuclease HI family protein [Candidatus Daviesbacteria bacterium]|nr:ribonuclease HI family protein [Candidatus Daviesbacteria bacterium]